MSTHRRHIVTCKGRATELKFPGKYYEDDKTICNQLEEFGIVVDDPYFDHFAVYAYKNILKPKCFINSNFSELLELKNII